MPGPRAWCQWKRALLLWATKKGKLYHSLQQWCVPEISRPMQWFSYQNPSTNKAYLFKNDRYLVYDTELNLLLRNETIISTSKLPEGTVPNDLHDSSLVKDFRFDPRFHPFLNIPTQNYQPSTFNKFITKQTQTSFLHDELQ